MQRRLLIATALLATALFPVNQALAFTIEQQSGSSADGASRIVDPDEQVDLFGLQSQTQTQGGSGSFYRNSNATNTNPILNGRVPGVILSNPYEPLLPPRR